MRYIAFLTLIFLLGNQSFAFSSDWVMVARTNKQKIYVDRESIEKETPRYVKAWEKTKYEDGIVDDTTSKIITLTETYDLYDCEQKNISSLKISDYDDNGQLVNNFDFVGNYYKDHPDKRWVKIEPGSIGEDILDYVCENSKSE